MRHAGAPGQQLPQRAQGSHAVDLRRQCNQFALPLRGPRTGHAGQVHSSIAERTEHFGRCAGRQRRHCRQQPAPAVIDGRVPGRRPGQAMADQFQRHIVGGKDQRTGALGRATGHRRHQRVHAGLQKTGKGRHIERGKAAPRFLRTRIQLRPAGSEDSGKGRRNHAVQSLCEKCSR